MKKATLEGLRNYLNSLTDVTDEVKQLRDEVNAEYDRTTAKSRANITLYDAAHEALMNAEGWTEPMTTTELWEVVEGVMPDGFTKSKMQYALLNYWKDEVVRHEGGKTLKYSKA